MTLLAEPRRAHLQQRRVVRAVRCMADRAIFVDGAVLPEERAAPFRVTGVASLIHAVVDHELRAERSVRVVAVRARHFSVVYRVCRDATKLCALRRMTGETHFRLSALRQHPLAVSVDLVAGS